MLVMASTGQQQRSSFMMLQEVRYKNVGKNIVKGGDAAHKLYWSGETWSWFDGSCELSEESD